MSANESRERIRARIWKAIAQTEIDLSSLPKPTLESLVNEVTDAAMLEIDDEINQAESTDKTASERYYPIDKSDGETVIWQGRPFLSISEHYVITDERVRIVRGLLGKERQDIELIRIQDIDQSQTLRERSLNLGDITINSHDRSAPLVVLNNVRDPQNVHEILRQAVQKARKSHGMTFQEEM